MLSSEEAGPLPTFSLRCGSGRNTFRWLAMVATQRYAQLCKLHGRPRTREAFHTEPGRFTAINVKKTMSKTSNSGASSSERSHFSLVNNQPGIRSTSCLFLRYPYIFRASNLYIPLRSLF